MGNFSWFNNNNQKGIILERFVDLIREIEPNDRWLIYYLSKKLINITIDSYPLHCERIVLEIDKKLGNNFEFIYILPILKDNECKIKSGHSISYFLESIFDTIYKHNFCGKIKLINHICNIKFFNNKKVLILFCDNFIGTGNQAIEYLNYYNIIKSNQSFTIHDTIAVVSIAILNEGLNNLKNQGYNIFFSHLHKKGISDDKYLNSMGALSIMKKIEQNMNIQGKWSLGYSQSEALIAFDFKAPNNTFPIFWLRGKNKRNTIFFR